MKRRELGLRSFVTLSLLSVLVCASCDSCSGCGDDPKTLARLVELTGTGIQRDFAAQPKQWQKAELGAQFAIGDAVRSDAASKASIIFVDESQLQLQPSTTVRFLADETTDPSKRGQTLDIETGEALLIASGRDLMLRTHVGLAVLQANGRLRITRNGENADYRVELGEVRFRDASGAETRIRAGENMEIGIGMAVMRRNAAAAKPDANAEPDANVEPDAPKGVLVNVGDAGITARDARGAWQELPQGEHTLEAGTGLRLPNNTSVKITRGKDRAVLRGVGEFVLGAGAMLFEIRSGEAQLDAADEDVEVIVPGGLIVAKAVDGGTDATVRISGGQGVLKVDRGEAAFKGLNGSESVASGDEWRWAAANVAPDDAQQEAGPDYFNLVARAGESFVVHAPEVPVAVAIDFRAKCGGDGFVELTSGKQRGRGTGRANLLMQSGSRAYAVRCADAKGGPGKLVARGAITVLRDAGTGKLPPSAPTSYVEADGRSYTIYYQNQLPDISVRWPNAPKADTYRLEVDGTALDLDKPEHIIKSGSLRDGTHSLAFHAQDRKSRAATIEISFDNAAPKASLFVPADRSFSPGSSVNIEGVALRGWKVELDGGTIETDASDRFAGQVATSAERPDIAVRLSHPRLGTHYYLRRAAGSR